MLPFASEYGVFSPVGVKGPSSTIGHVFSRRLEKMAHCEPLSEVHFGQPTSIVLILCSEADPRALADDGLSPYTAAILREATWCMRRMRSGRVAREKFGRCLMCGHEDGKATASRFAERFFVFLLLVLEKSVMSFFAAPEVWMFDVSLRGF